MYLVHGIIMFGCSLLYQNTKDVSYVLNINNILNNYKQALSNTKLLVFALTIGEMTVFSYCYATSSFFITSQLFGFSSAEYGLWNTMTIISIVKGSLIVVKIVNKYSSESILIIALVTMMSLLILLAVLQLVGAVTI